MLVWRERCGALMSSYSTKSSSPANSYFCNFSRLGHHDDALMQWCGRRWLLFKTDLSLSSGPGNNSSSGSFSSSGNNPISRRWYSWMSANCPRPNAPWRAEFCQTRLFFLYASFEEEVLVVVAPMSSSSSESSSRCFFNSSLSSFISSTTNHTNCFYCRLFLLLRSRHYLNFCLHHVGFCLRGRR